MNFCCSVLTCDTLRSLKIIARIAVPPERGLGGGLCSECCGGSDGPLGDLKEAQCVRTPLLERLPSLPPRRLVP